MLDTVVVESTPTYKNNGCYSYSNVELARHVDPFMTMNLACYCSSCNTEESNERISDPSWDFNRWERGFEERYYLARMNGFGVENS